MPPCKNILPSSPPFGGSHTNIDLLLDYQDPTPNILRYSPPGNNINNNMEATNPSLLFRATLNLPDISKLVIDLIAHDANLSDML